MKRGILWAVLVVGGAQTALADEPTRTQNRPAPAASGTTERTRESEPTFFDLSVSQGEGRSAVIYRYYRAEKKLVQVERLGDADSLRRIKAFKKVNNLADAKIAVAPEGPKSPPSPPPGGGERGVWKVPEAELQDAIQQLKAKEPAATDISVGQLPPAAPGRK